MKRRPARNFHIGQKALEGLQALITKGHWPARVAELFQVAPRVAAIHYRFKVPQPLGSAPRLRIAFAADWHAGPTTSPKTLDDAVAKIQEHRPDVILLGGDFVSLEAANGADLVPVLRRLEAPRGVFGVLGNHDHWAGASRILEYLAAGGVTPLENRNIRLSAPFENVSIVGIDDHVSGHPDAEAAFAGAAQVRILLMHQPSGLLDLNGDAFDLALAGHTHGGQIALPSGIPIFVPPGQLSRRFAAGRFETERGPLVVSRGVGCTLLPFRWNAPADVILIELEGPTGRPPR